MVKDKIHAFDFDGTLTNRDTLLLFILFSASKVKLITGAALFLPLVAIMKLHLLPNWKVKQLVFSFFFAGMKENDFDALCIKFSTHYRKILRHDMMLTLRKVLESGGQVVVVSASIDRWVASFFTGMPITVIGTQIEVREGIVTGKFKTRNCYGMEKVIRILEIFPNRDEYELVAYGDSRGDREMLDFADEAHLL